MLYFLAALFFVSVSYLAIRQYALILWRRSSCPRCNSTLVRIRRTQADRFWEIILLRPVKRYQCDHHRCHWQGRSVLTIHHEKNDTLQSVQPIQSTLVKPSSTVTLESDDIVKTDLSQNLYTALQKKDFILNYHPIVSIVTNNITGIEVLLRWKHSEDGLLSAAQFIHQIEGNKTFLLIGEWILKKSLDQLKYWHNLGLKPLTLSMNLSSHQFYEPNLISILSKALKNIDIDPYSFELEVTESTILQDKSSAQQILLDLQNLGIKVAIDDFDMDTFSIKELRKFAFNTIKIHQHLIHKLTLKSDEFVKIRFLMSMAQDYNLNVVAEGVETREQLNLLRSLDCETVQGYLFDYPLAAEDATDVLQANWLGRKNTP